MQQVQIPPLAEGEVYLGGHVDVNGDIEHSVAIGFNDKCMSQQEQREWAKSLGGVLMNRFEALFIYNERRDLVKDAAYWTDDEVEWDSAAAWCQSFLNGYQFLSHKSAALRAVAVRRFKN